MKKFFCMLLAVVLLAAVLPQMSLAEEAGIPDVIYEGREAVFRRGLKLADGTLYAALPDLATLFGAQYRTVPSGRSFLLRLGGDCLRIWQGSVCANRNGEAVTFRTPSVLRDGALWVPLEDAAEALYMGVDREEDTVYITRRAGIRLPPKGVRLPILMYHAVSDDIWGTAELFVSPAELEKQLLYLQENGYTTVTFEDMSRIDRIEKPVFLTFDDGYRDNYTELFPLLQKYQAKATVFVITDAIGNPLYLTEEMIAEMSASGLVSIQSHTDTHPNLSTLGGEATRREMETSQKKLLHITGKRPFVLCYPEGKFSDTTLREIGDYYSYGLKMTGGLWTTSEDVYRISRVYVSRYTDIGTFAGKVRT